MTTSTTAGSRRFFIPVALAALGLSTLTSGPARAQEAPALEGEFSAQRFEPAPGPNNYLSVATARTSGEWALDVGLMFDYARDPFVLQSCASAEDCDNPAPGQLEAVRVVRDLATFNLLASLTPIDRLQIGLRLPMVLTNGEGLDPSTGSAMAGGLSGFGLGDVMLEGKVRIIGEPKDTFVLGAALDLSAPLGVATVPGTYSGNSGPISGGLRLIADLEVENFSFVVNARGVYREAARVGFTTFGSEFRYSAAAGYRIGPILQLMAEGYGATQFSAANGTNTFEAGGGAHLFPIEMLRLTLAGSAGVVKGAGVPVGRLMVGIALNFGGDSDRDGDQVPDRRDECPDEPEDRDGVMDDDGCPEDDPDGDTFPDSVDRCPMEAENNNGYQDDDGCRDEIPPGWKPPTKAAPKKPAPPKKTAPPVAPETTEPPTTPPKPGEPGKPGDKGPVDPTSPPASPPK